MPQCPTTGRPVGRSAGRPVSKDSVVAMKRIGGVHHKLLVRKIEGAGRFSEHLRGSPRLGGARIDSLVREALKNVS